MILIGFRVLKLNLIESIIKFPYSDDSIVIREMREKYSRNRNLLVDDSILICLLLNLVSFCLS